MRLHILFPVNISILLGINFLIRFYLTHFFNLSTKANNSAEHDNFTDMLISDFYNNVRKEEDFSLENDTINSGDNSEILLNENNVKCNKLSFRNVSFDNMLHLHNFTLKNNISFINCTFYKGLVIDGITINQIDTKKTSLLIYNCNFHSGDLRISRSLLLNGETEIVKTTGLSSIFVFNSKFLSFNIRECEIKDDYLFRNNSFYSTLSLQKSEFQCSIRQNNNSYGSFTIRKNVFKKDLLFNDTVVNEEILINDNEFFEEVRFDPYSTITEGSTLKIQDNVFKRSIEFKFFKKEEQKENEKKILGGVSKIYIGSNSFENGLIISGKKFYDENPPIKQFTLNISNKNEGLIKISDFDFNGILIAGENYKGNIIFRNISCNKIRFDTFANYGSFQLINLEPLSENSEFQLVESYLENLQFINCDILGFSTYHVYNSNLSKIISSYTRWFNYESLAKPIDEIKKLKGDPSSKGGFKQVLKEQVEIRYLGLREIFRQLKHAMESQGDKVEALNFRSYEMEAYFNYLKMSTPWHHKNRLILFLGKTNEHGINWIRPLFILGGVTILFYILILYSIHPNFRFGFGELQLKYFLSETWNYKKDVIEILNPTHNISKIFPEKFYVSGYALGYDVLYKIIFSFLVFQIISAFRKFVK